MNKFGNTLLSLGLSLFLFGGVSIGQELTCEERYIDTNFTTAQKFYSVDNNGIQRDFEERFTKEYFLVNLSKADCPGCVSEAQRINADANFQSYFGMNAGCTYGTFVNSGSLNQRNEQFDTESFVVQHSYDLRGINTYYLPLPFNTTAADVLPVFMLINREGQVVRRYEGQLPFEIVDDYCIQQDACVAQRGGGESESGSGGGVGTGSGAGGSGGSGGPDSGSGNTQYGTGSSTGGTGSTSGGGDDGPPSGGNGGGPGGGVGTGTENGSGTIESGSGSTSGGGDDGTSGTGSTTTGSTAGSGTSIIIGTGIVISGGPWWNGLGIENGSGIELGFTGVFVGTGWNGGGTPPEGGGGGENEGGTQQGSTGETGPGSSEGGGNNPVQPRPPRSGSSNGGTGEPGSAPPSGQQPGGSGTGSGEGGSNGGNSGIIPPEITIDSEQIQPGDLTQELGRLQIEIPWEAERDVVTNESILTTSNSKDSLRITFRQINRWLWILFGASILAGIVYAGFRFITAAGDPEKTKSALKTFVYIGVAFAIALFSFILVRLITNLFV